MRILALNMCGCRPEQVERIKELRASTEKHQIDMSLFNEANAKQNATNVERVEREMKKIRRGTKILALDSKKQNVTKRNYLLGGLLNTMQNKHTAIIDQKIRKLDSNPIELQW